MKISTGIELMIDSFRNSVVENQVELKKLPVIIDFKKELPSTGEVRMLILTEKQFENCLQCQEKPDLQEKLVGAKEIQLKESLYHKSRL